MKSECILTIAILMIQLQNSFSQDTVKINGILVLGNNNINSQEVGVIEVKKEGSTSYNKLMTFNGDTLFIGSNYVIIPGLFEANCRPVANCISVIKPIEINLSATLDVSEVGLNSFSECSDTTTINLRFNKNTISSQLTYDCDDVDSFYMIPIYATHIINNHIDSCIVQVAIVDFFDYCP
jgi:hypothetical protein